MVPGLGVCLGEHADEAFEEVIAVVGEGEASKGLEFGVSVVDYGAAAKEAHQHVGEVAGEVFRGAALAEAFEGEDDKFESAEG